MASCPNILLGGGGGGGAEEMKAAGLLLDRSRVLVVEECWVKEALPLH